MWPFNRKKSVVKDTASQNSGRIEIVGQQSMTEEAKRQIDEANAHLHKLFEDNHFSLKIYLAASPAVTTKKAKD